VAATIGPGASSRRAVVDAPAEWVAPIEGTDSIIRHLTRQTSVRMDPENTSPHARRFYLRNV